MIKGYVNRGNVCASFARGIIVAASLFLMAGPARAQTVVQTFFVPFDEEEVNLALNTIDNFGGRIGNTIRSTISIVGGITNTIIYYDHWEDGYEGNIMFPTQSTTQVWGDNNPANGIPPGFTTDLIGEGDIITLLNDIPIPRNPANIYYDARDKVSVTRWIAMSRYLFAPNPGEVLADSSQVYDRSKFGFNFRAPVGINTGTNQMFEYSSIHVAAGYDATVVTIDTDADGNFDETIFLNAGESYVSRFTFQGARIQASKPIQAHLVTGDIGSNYEMRFFELFADNQWDTNYFTSVHTAGGINTDIYIFNPNDEEMNVHCETLSGTTVVPVGANNLSIYRMPINTGGSIYSTNGMQFIPVSATDSGQAISGNQAFDWGHALVPVRALTTVSIVPWAPGAGGNPMSSINANPVWVTAEQDTTLYVDLDGNTATGPLVDPFGRRYDFSTNISRLQSIRIFDNSDNDQTGMRLYTLDGSRFATTWGQDPAISPPGNPYLDMGAAVFPFPTVPAVKEWELYNDVNDDGIVNPGDSIRFTIYVVNVGFSDANNVVVYDTGAANTTYELGSSFLNGTNITDDAVPPFETEFPFDELGYNVGYIPIGQTSIVSYVVMINDPFPTNTDGIVNGVYVDNQTQVFVPVPIPGFIMTKSSPTNLFSPNDIITYTLDIVSTANVSQAGVQVIDQLPANMTYVPNSTRVYVDGDFTGNFRDEFNVIDEYDGSDGSLQWSSDWLEIGESDGSGSGNIQVMTDTSYPEQLYMLRIQNSSRGAFRRADIGRFTNVTLRYDYRRESLESGDAVSLSVSTNGGSTWTVLSNLAGPATDAGYVSVSNVNLTAFRSTNFAIRFLGNSNMDSGDRVWIDNVELLVRGNNVTNFGNPTPTLISGYVVGSGQTVRITFDAQINGNISVSSVVNRAFINSFASPAPLEASVTNYVLLPERSRIAGWVRNDTDGNGNVNGSYAGISGVPLTLYTDPNGDGNPADGAVVASAFTDGTGFFELGYFLSNNYVILQTDLVNWRSTGDSDGGNPNLISFTTASGVDYTNNIFLDTRLASITGQVRDDADGDGNLSDPDDGIPGVTIYLYTDPNADGNPADGMMVSSRVTNAGGEFEFSNVTTGNYVLVQVDLPGMFSTADSSEANDNRIPLYLPGGIDSGNHAFLDANSGLTITKSASPPGIWFPEMMARYTITVANTGAFTHTGIQISDYLGTGLTFEAGSTYIQGADNFVTVVYTNVGTNGFVVPAGVSNVSVKAWGGGGGGGGGGSVTTGGAGGGGGFAASTITVTSGETLDVMVGGGGLGGVNYPSGNRVGAGGAGGGYSGVLRGTNKLIIAGAGGGGGGGDNQSGAGAGGAGGPGGGTSGVNGGNSSGSGTPNAGGGQSGSSTSGGNTGGGNTSDTVPGTDGVSLSGGVGGQPVGSSSPPDAATGGVNGGGSGGLGNSSTGRGGGGGGGAGHFGGGGGTACNAGADSGAGGGGGSGFTSGVNNTNAAGSGRNPARNTDGDYIGGLAVGGLAGSVNNDGGNGESGIVVIRFTDPGFGIPPDMISGITLLSGESITIVFTAQVASAVSAVTNRACVISDALFEPLCTTIVNTVDPEADPDRISGQVRFDVDGDGNLNDADFGIQGVVLHLYSDPNGDGNPIDGVLLDTTITDFGGYYIFGNLVAGDYVVVLENISGYESTGDADGGTDGRIAIDLPGGVDSRDNDFLTWTVSGLTITKTSSAGDVVVPGELLTYSIIVSNARNVTAHGIRVEDYLPVGLEYIPSSAWTVIDGVEVANNVRDFFDAVSYSNDDGDTPWITNWIESNDSGGASAGSIYVTTDFSSLRLRLANLNRNIRRSANISGGTYATLSYYYRRQSLESGEYVMVEISTNNANPWVELNRHSHVSGGGTSQSDSSYQLVTIDILEYASTNTTIRFRTPPSGNMNNADIVWFDDVSIDWGYSASIATNAFEPPIFFTNQLLTAGGFITISFTTDVQMADTIVNTAVVYTASDTNGLRSYASNFVGVIAMTQGFVKVESDALAVKVGWSAYTDDEGEVSKEYDVMVVDDGVAGFHPGLTNMWEWAATIQDSGFTDMGDSNRTPPEDMGNQYMRFYRASFKGSWGIEKSPRYASREIYVAKCSKLKEGENFISLFMEPDENRVAFIFGTNLLPAGSSMLNSTRIEWYAPTAQSEATNVIWLSDAGVWQHSEGGIANNLPVPLNQGFNLILPAGSGDRDLVLVGRVPTNTTEMSGHTIPIVANENYNIVSYNVPYRIRLIDSGLKESGFSGASPGQPVNPNTSDELRVLRRGGGSMQSPLFRILMNSSGNFHFWTGGSGSANNLVLEPDYALIIYTKKSKTNFTWNVSLPYPEPSVFMTP